MSSLHVVENSEITGTDPLDTEFRYYSKLVKDLVLLLANPKDRELFLAWVRKLSSPGYSIKQLQQKRNSYLLILCMCAILNSMEGPFATLPPLGALNDLTLVRKHRAKKFSWEIDNAWERELDALKELEAQKLSVMIEQPTKCFMHKFCPDENDNEKSISKTLDTQFRFLLHKATPYAALLRSGDRLRAAKWLQTLCGYDKHFCLISKGIRNDYMIVLTGYLANRQLVGPFRKYPSQQLPPLAEMATIISDEKHPITDPTHPRTVEFFRGVPKPEEGAFALIAITEDF